MTPDHDAIPALGQINIVTRDVDAMVEFYRVLGVSFPADGPLAMLRHHRSAADDGEASLDLDSLAFAQVWDTGWPSDRLGPLVSFTIGTREGVDGTFAALVTAGYRGEQEPYDAFWGSRFAVILDPDGNPVGLMSPSDPAFRSAPPAPRSAH